MGKENFSFDIVSEANLQEIDNAVNQVKKEIQTRFDFKGAGATIDYLRDEKKIIFVCPDDFKLRAMKDILLTKMIKRGVSQRFLVFKDFEKVFGQNLRQEIEITSGIQKERAKELNIIIKNLNLKVHSQIEGEKIRVFSPKKDDLQAVIQHLRSIDFPIPLSFTNYR